MSAACVLDRAIAVLREETAGLRADAAFDVHASSLRKHRLLLELHHVEPGPADADRLRAFRDALNENGVELEARLAAARRIADIAIGVVREDGRDGTYRAGPR